MPDPRQSGLHIALLGIDGAGKSAYCTRLRDDLRAEGLDSQILNWRDIPSACPGSIQRKTLEEAFANCFRALLAATPEGQLDLQPSVARALLLPGAALLDAGIGPRLRAEDRGPAGGSLINRQGILSAALFEMSSQTYAALGLIDRLVASGTVAISESFGLKYVIKLVSLLRALDPGSEPSARALLAAAQAVFGELLKPDIGIFIDTPEAVAWGRVRSRRQAIGLTEDMFLLGDGDEEAGFLRMQSACRKEYRRHAIENDWLHFSPPLAGVGQDYESLRAIIMPRILEKLGQVSNAGL